MTVACPCCKASNTAGPACRRCKADLAELFAVAAQAERLLAEARARLRAGDARRAATIIETVIALRRDPEALRLRALGGLPDARLPRGPGLAPIPGGRVREVVLIVDDEESVRRTFADWLQAAPGAPEVLSAADAEEALILANDHPVDLAVLDWNLGSGTDGLRLLEDLFGPGGASNGCWCMYWLLGPSYHRRPRSQNREALRRAATEGPAPGLLALDDSGRALGWARLTPRSELPWLNTKRELAAVDDLPVWSLPCFYIRRTARGQGVQRALITAAVDVAAEAGAPALEAYPVDTSVPGATRNLFPGSRLNLPGCRLHRGGAPSPDPPDPPPHVLVGPQWTAAELREEFLDVRGDLRPVRLDRPVPAVEHPYLHVGQLLPVRLRGLRSVELVLLDPTARAPAAGAPEGTPAPPDSSPRCPCSRDAGRASPRRPPDRPGATRPGRWPPDRSAATDPASPARPPRSPSAPRRSAPRCRPGQSGQPWPTGRQRGLRPARVGPSRCSAV